MSSDLIFHDLTSQKWPASWSPFTIRTLLCLHFLNLPYTHNEVSYPDIASLLQSLNVSPPPESAGKSIKFTLPAISINAETTMGSSLIAEKLASLSPQHADKLFPQGEKSRNAVEAKFDEKEFWDRVVQGLGFGMHVVAFVPLFLDERGAEYFLRTREARLGDSLESLREEALKREKEVGLGERVKKAVLPILELYEGLDEEDEGKGKSGVFAFGGEQPQYLDFCVVGLLQWWIYARGETEIMAALEEVGGGRLARIMQGCKHLLEARIQ